MSKQSVCEFGCHGEGCDSCTGANGCGCDDCEPESADEQPGSDCGCEGACGCHTAPEGSDEPCEERAREDIGDAIREWDRIYPLAWTVDEMVSYWIDADICGQRMCDGYRRAVAAQLEKALETERRGFEQRAGAFWIARFDYPGARNFSFVVCESEEEARRLVDEAAEEAETVQERERARNSAAVCADKVLWETYLDKKLVYSDLLRAL